MDVESGGDVDSTQGRVPAGEPGYGASGVAADPGGSSTARAPASDLTAGHRSYPWLDVLFLVVGVLTLAAPSLSWWRTVTGPASSGTG